MARKGGGSGNPGHREEQQERYSGERRGARSEGAAGEARVRASRLSPDCQRLWSRVARRRSRRCTCNKRQALCLSILPIDFAFTSLLDADNQSVLAGGFSFIVEWTCQCKRFASEVLPVSAGSAAAAAADARPAFTQERLTEAS